MRRGARRRGRDRASQDTDAARSAAGAARRARPGAPGIEQRQTLPNSTLSKGTPSQKTTYTNVGPRFWNAFFEPIAAASQTAAKSATPRARNARVTASESSTRCRASGSGRPAAARSSTGFDHSAPSATNETTGRSRPRNRRARSGPAGPGRRRSRARPRPAGAEAPPRPLPRGHVSRLDAQVEDLLLALFELGLEAACDLGDEDDARGSSCFHVLVQVVTVKVHLVRHVRPDDEGDLLVFLRRCLTDPVDGPAVLDRDLDLRPGCSGLRRRRLPSRNPRGRRSLVVIAAPRAQDDEQDHGDDGGAEQQQPAISALHRNLPVTRRVRSLRASATGRPTGATRRRGT